MRKQKAAIAMTGCLVGIVALLLVVVATHEIKPAWSFLRSAKVIQDQAWIESYQGVTIRSATGISRPYQGPARLKTNGVYRLDEDIALVAGSVRAELASPVWKEAVGPKKITFESGARHVTLLPITGQNMTKIYIQTHRSPNPMDRLRLWLDQARWP